MDLEAKIKAFAEEARRILLQRALESKGQLTGKAFWQGYTSNGNGLVKLPDGQYKIVKVIGNVVVPKNTVVYIDGENTVEVGFRRELPQARDGKKQQPKVTVAQRIRRPLLLIDDRIPVFGWIVIYYSNNNIFNANNGSATSAICDDRQYYPFYQTYDSDSGTHSNNQPATHGKCLRVSAAYAYAQMSLGPNNYSASATASVGSI